MEKVERRSERGSGRIQIRIKGYMIETGYINTLFRGFYLWLKIYLC